MKVAIRWKGEELKYIDPKELIIDDMTLTDFVQATKEKQDSLQKKLQEQQESITVLVQELQKVKLENIEVVKGLISR